MKNILSFFACFIKTFFLNNGHPTYDESTKFVVNSTTIGVTYAEKVVIIL